MQCILFDNRYRISNIIIIIKQKNANCKMGVGVVDSDHHHDDINRTSRELFWDVEQKLLMHKLAKEYYGFR